jgi:hypothetical protein
MWTRESGIELCIAVEEIAKQCGYHIGLTGGLLYKSGERKDLDIVVYSVRQVNPNQDKLFRMLAQIGIQEVANYGFVVKARFLGKSIDLLFPETEKSDDPQYGGFQL